MRQIDDYSSLFTTRRNGGFETSGPFDSPVPGVLTFSESGSYLEKALANGNVAAIVVPPALVERALAANIAVAEAEQAREAFFLVHNRIAGEIAQGYPAAAIAAEAVVAPTARIMPGAVVGAGAEIRDFAFIGSGCRIGEGAFVGEGALIGVDGHFEQRHGDRRLRVRHVGTVDIGAGAQVLAGAIVQRDVFAFRTSVGMDAVVGPGVRVAHGVQIGRSVVLAGGTVVAGYSKIDDDAWIGPGCTIGNRLTIGKGARIEIGSVVVAAVEPAARLSGNFAISHTANLRRWRSAAISRK